MPSAAAPVAPAVTPDRLMTIGNGYWIAQMLSAAAHYKFFSLIASGHRSADAIAGAAGTDPVGTRMVLDSLVSVDLLTKQNGAYGLSAEADAFLIEGRPGNLSLMVDQVTDLQWNNWGHLKDALKHRPAVTTMSGTAEGKEFFPKLIRAIMPLGLGPADATAEHLGIGTRRTGVRVLDVGAGAAAWSIPFARRDAASEITAFDLPEVLPETQKIVDELGVGRRYRLVAGDLRKDDFGRATYDVAILGNICHGLVPADNKDVFRRLHAALKPGGELVIGDMLPNEDRTGPPFPVMFAVNMYVMGGGDTYRLSEYTAWLRETGFGRVTTFDTHRSHSEVIIASR